MNTGRIRHRSIWRVARPNDSLPPACLQNAVLQRLNLRRSLLLFVEVNASTHNHWCCYLNGYKIYEPLPSMKANHIFSSIGSNYFTFHHLRSQVILPSWLKQDIGRVSVSKISGYIPVIISKPKRDYTFYVCVCLHIFILWVHG